MIRAKVLRRKCSKMLSKPHLKATFSDVCLVKTEFKSNDLRIQLFVLEKPYIVSMCIVEIHEIKQTESKQTKTYNLGQNLLRHITKILIFCTYRDKNVHSRKLKDFFPPSPIAMLFTVTEEMLTWAVKPKQHCSRGTVERRGGGGGGEFVPFRHDGCMVRN